MRWSNSTPPENVVRSHMDMPASMGLWTEYSVTCVSFFSTMAILPWKPCASRWMISIARGVVTADMSKAWPSTSPFTWMCVPMLSGMNFSTTVL